MEKVIKILNVFRLNSTNMPCQIISHENFNEFPAKHLKHVALCNVMKLPGGNFMRLSRGGNLNSFSSKHKWFKLGEVNSILSSSMLIDSFPLSLDQTLSMERKLWNVQN